MSPPAFQSATTSESCPDRPMNPFGCANRTGDLKVPVWVPLVPKTNQVVGDEDSASAATVPSPSIAVALQASPFTAGTSNVNAAPGAGGMTPLQSASGPPSLPPSGVTEWDPPSPAASAGARPPHAINPTEKQRRLPTQRMPAPQRRERCASGRRG